MDIESECVTSQSTPNMPEIHEDCLNNVSVLNSQKYMEVTKLNDKTYGVLSLRTNAVYQKIYNNKRLIKTEDLKIIDGITKGQNLAGTTALVGSGSLLMSACSKTLSYNIQARAMCICAFGAVAGVGGVVHYSYKFAKFIDYVNNKYFYGMSLRDLQNQTIIKTNKPRSLKFEEASWNI